MPELEAYRASLRPHAHDWQSLGHDGVLEWCPGCGHVRATTADDDEVEECP